MIPSFRDIPIKRKLTLAIMIASMATLLLVSASLFVFQWLSARETIKHDLKAQAEIIGAISTAALTFQDSQAATEILSALKAKPFILGASLYLPDGKQFAFYGQESFSRAMLENPAPEALRFEGSHLLLFQPVILDKSMVGTLRLRYDFRAMEREILMPFLPISAGILAASLLLAILLSSTLQRAIAAPTLRLAATARTVAGNKDYSVRAEQSGRDEIGALTQAFNQMLARIQEQDASLRAAGERYERQQQTLTELTRGEALYEDDLNATLRRLCEAAARTLGSERASLWRWDAGRTALHCEELYELSLQRHSTVSNESMRCHIARFSSPQNAVIVTGDDAATVPCEAQFKDGCLSPLGNTSVLDAPISLNGQVIGVLCLEHVGPARHWEPDETMFATAMTNLVSMAFGHWERKQTQAELEGAMREHRAFLRYILPGRIICFWPGRSGIYSPRHSGPRDRPNWSR
jgi:HAMP domain-containing protein